MPENEEPVPFEETVSQLSDEELEKTRSVARLQSLGGVAVCGSAALIGYDALMGHKYVLLSMQMGIGIYGSIIASRAIDRLPIISNEFQRRQQ